jgi:hypothetical protein
MVDMNLLTRRYFPLLFLSAVLGAVACSDQRSVTDPRQLVPQQPGREIVDGNHGGGNTDVFFLPPIVGNPSKATGYGDPFQAGLVVSFVVTDLSTNTVVKTFSNVPVDPTNQFYAANWNTKGTTIDISHLYRISVVVGSKNVAHADVVFGANASSLKNIDTDDFIGLVDGQTLPIKVRIERGWDCLDKTSCVTQVVPATIPSGQTVTVTTGGTLPDSVRFTSNSAGIWATNVDGSPLTVPVIVTVQDITSLRPESAGGCAAGLGIRLSQNHCVQITTDPQIKLASPATVGTCLANPGDDRQLLLKYSTEPTHPEPIRFLAEAPPPIICPPPQIGSAIQSSNPMVRFAATTLAYLGRGLNWVAGVKTAYAFDAGVGGIVEQGDGFSSFSPAFPEQMSKFSGDNQRAIAGTQTADELVVHLAFVHDVGEGGLSPNVTGASLTCTALTAGAGFTTSRATSVPATELGNGRYSCGRPYLAQTPGPNQFKVTAAGLLDAVLFDTGDETITLAGSVTFTEQGFLSPIARVAIDQTSLNLQLGDQPVLHATVTLTEGSDASTAVNWSIVSNTPSGAIAIKAAGNAVEVIANALGTATLRATSVVDPAKFMDATIDVTPSFYGEVSDPSGDAAPPPSNDPAPDVVFASMTAARGNLDIVIRFPSGVRVPGTTAHISFDTDQNIATGFPGLDGANRDRDKVGVDYIMLVGEAYNSGKGQLYRNTGPTSFALVSELTAQFVGDEMHITIPLSALNDDGALDFKIQSQVLLSTGGFTAALDIAPNVGLAGGRTLPSVPAPIQ